MIDSGITRHFRPSRDGGTVSPLTLIDDYDPGYSFRTTERSVLGSVDSNDGGALVTTSPSTQR